MQRYSGSWPIRLGLLMMAACGFGGFYFMVILAAQRVLERSQFPAVALLASIPSGLIGLVMGAESVYLFAASFRAYELDGPILHIRSPRGEHQVDLSTVREYHRLFLDAMTLVDGAGTRYRIETGVLSKQKEFRATLNERLATARERQMERFAAEGTAIYPARSIAILFGIIAIVVLGFAVAGLVDPSLFAGGSDRLLAVGFMLLPSSGVTGLAARFYTWQLRFTPEAIESATLFGKQRIPWNSVETVTTRAIRTKNGTTQVTTVHGLGPSITFQESYADYDLMRGMAERWAGVEAVRDGQSAVPRIEKEQRRRSLIGVTLLSLFGLGGFGLWGMTTAEGRLSRYDRIDREGTRTEGVVTGRYLSEGSKTTDHVVEYSFEAGGRTYRHASPVTPEMYGFDTPGRRIQILYVPGEPDLCCAVDSIGRQSAEARLHVAYVNLAMAAGFPLFAFLAMLRADRRSLSKRIALPAEKGS